MLVELRRKTLVMLVFLSCLHRTILSWDGLMVTERQLVFIRLSVPQCHKYSFVFISTSTHLSEILRTRVRQVFLWM